MSLPTYAHFYDKDNKVIASQFVNVGWFLDCRTFSAMILTLPFVKDAEYLIAYGIKVDKKWLNRPQDISPNDWKKEITDAAVAAARIDAVEF